MNQYDGYTNCKQNEEEKADGPLHQKPYLKCQRNVRTLARGVRCPNKGGDNLQQWEDGQEGRKKP